MEMSVVQIFRQPELTDTIAEEGAKERWLELIEEMGLVGQIKAKGSEPENAPIPYLVLNSQLKEVVKTLCKEEIDYKEFTFSAIPIEVLEVISHSVKENMFTKICIRWNDDIKDPIVVGYKGNYYAYRGNSWRSDDIVKGDTKQETINQLGETNKKNSIYFNEQSMYLIARWGDENKPIETLRIEASERYKKETNNRINQEIIKLQNELRLLEIETQTKFGI